MPILSAACASLQIIASATVVMILVAWIILVVKSSTPLLQAMEAPKNTKYVARRAELHSEKAELR
jgi:hypothetical protein